MSGQQRLRMTADTADLAGRTYYDILGLPVSPRHVTLQEIKAAYHRSLLTAHPDKVLGATGAELDLVCKAFQVLSDDVLRKEYDAKIKGTLNPKYGR
jgi:diphthamide biosynthesis protein 4